MDILRFDSTPQFDVVKRTMEYVNAPREEYASYQAEDYIFRGSIIGPITGHDVRATQDRFDLLDAYPDIERGVFGFQVDPSNPYRCLFFERWTGTHTGVVKVFPFLELPATNKRVECPMHVTSVTWNPQGKITYEAISPPVDRFEGNTGGAGAVLGLLTGAGVDSGPSSVGLPSLMLQQKLSQALGLVGKQWSDQEDIPGWWKSSARGADPNDI